MELSEILKNDGELPRQRKIYALVLKLGVPAILAQIASVAMQYIDAAMVGSLGAFASASIGVVTSSTWIVIGLSYAVAMGFSVQIAHAIGANDEKQAKKVFREGLIICCATSCLLTFIGISLSSHLPSLMGAEQKIWHDASAYFFIYSCSIPAMLLRVFSVNVLQCAGNTKTPSILNSLLCFFNIFFNYFLIFPTREVIIGNFSFTIFGAGLGVAGAALGTACSEVVISIAMFIVAFRMPNLHFDSLSLKFSRGILKAAGKISGPMALESVVMNGAYIVTTSIVAPLGAVSLAADIFGFITEQVCYLPGFGICIAATTLVGQALGANRKVLARKFAWSAVKCGVLIVTTTAIAMYFLAPVIFSWFTPDAAVQELGVKILRIELLSEPLFAASTVIVGALRGAKDTFIPSMFTFIGEWFVFIPLALFLVKDYGLIGVWIGICANFCIRGIFFLLRLRNEKSWLKIEKMNDENIIQ